MTNKNSNRRSILDFILASVEAERKGGLTLEKWTYIRNHGTPDEIAEAVELMEAMGGYDALS